MTWNPHFQAAESKHCFIYIFCIKHLFWSIFVFYFDQICVLILILLRKLNIYWYVRHRARVWYLIFSLQWLSSFRKCENCVKMKAGIVTYWCCISMENWRYYKAVTNKWAAVCTTERFSNQHAKASNTLFVEAELLLQESKNLFNVLKSKKCLDKFLSLFMEQPDDMSSI